MFKNVAGSLWITLLIGMGCIVFSKLEDSARHDRCLMRGAVLCHDTGSAALAHSEFQGHGLERSVGFAAYLKRIGPLPNVPSPEIRFFRLF